MDEAEEVAEHSNVSPERPGSPPELRRSPSMGTADEDDSALGLHEKEQVSQKIVGGKYTLGLG